ncbi:hypothetical protein PINS_up010654 [Pythium insidiosum]|nr:hypothetical protein PINS_up010654 [Pythium insidiosum]
MRWRLPQRRVSRGAALVVATSAPFGFFARPSSSPHETLVEATGTADDSDKDTGDTSSAKRIVTQQWTLHSDSTATSSAIHSVTVDLPGLTVVQASNNTTTNTTNNDASHHNLGVVQVAADSPELLSCVDVEPLPPTELQLRFRREDTACREIQGRLLTSLTLSRARQVNSLEMDGGGTVVVRDGVLVADAPRSHLSIALAGGGDAQVSIQDPVHVGSLSVVVPDAGLLQFLADGGIESEKNARLSVVSSGQLHAFAPRIKTPLLRLNVFGEGSVALKMENDLENQTEDAIEVDKIKHRIVGDAAISVFGRGTARIHRAFIIGGGTIDAREVVGEDVSMEAYGEMIMTTRVAPDAKTKSYGFGGTLHTEPIVVAGPRADDEDAPPVEPSADDTPLPSKLTPIERRYFPTDEQLVASALFGSDTTVVNEKKGDTRFLKFLGDF